MWNTQPDNARWDGVCDTMWEQAEVMDPPGVTQLPHAAHTELVSVATPTS